MKDGDIDYSHCTAQELREALGGIRRDLYPKNHANIIAALAAVGEAVAVPPTTATEASDSNPDGPADRGSRLGAALIDSVIILAIVLPIEYAAGFWQVVMDSVERREQIPFWTTAPWLVFGILVFVLLQGYPLARDGQTWGKKALGIKIVDMQGNKASIARLSVRCAVYMLVGVIPFLGRLLSLTDMLLIFRSDKRCGHDLLAGTRVVKVVAPQTAAPPG